MLEYTAEMNKVCFIFYCLNQLYKQNQQGTLVEGVQWVQGVQGTRFIYKYIKYKQHNTKEYKGKKSHSFDHISLCNSKLENII